MLGSGSSDPGAKYVCEEGSGTRSGSMQPRKVPPSPAEATRYGDLAETLYNIMEIGPKKEKGTVSSLL